MPVRTKSGRVLSDAELDRLATNAEAGFDLSAWRPHRGRPSLGATAGEHAPRIAVRVPEALRHRAKVRAETEGRSISEVVRSLLEEYAPEPAPELAPSQRRPADPGVDAASQPVRVSAARHER